MFGLGAAGVQRVAVRAASTYTPGAAKAVVFDLGGVVVSSPVHAIRSYEAKHGFERDQLNLAMGGAGDFAKLERGELTMDTFGPQFESTLSEKHGMRVNVRKVGNQDAAVRQLSQMVGLDQRVTGALRSPMQTRGFHSSRVVRQNNAPMAGYGLNHMSPKAKDAYDRLLVFMDEHVYPNEKAIVAHGLQLGPERWTVNPIIEDLKQKAKAANLWNLFLPLESDREGKYGHGLTNFEYAHIAEILGRVPLSSEIFNCSAPDTGNMEVLVCYGSEEQKALYLEPMLNGEIRSCFSMTEPRVASSDATNVESSIVRDGDEYVINGLKHWISGACDPRCKFTVFLGKTDPSAPKHQQQSMILIPMDAPGVNIIRPMNVLGFEDAPHGHAEIEFKDVRVPASMMLLGEGRGFEIAQGRLGPGRIHHCMRVIGIAERALECMVDRVQKRVAFGKPLAEQSSILQDIAKSRIDIDQARLLTLRCAHSMDAYGKKAALDDIAMIKIVAPNMASRVLDRVMQAHGASGLSMDFPMAEGFAYARTLRLADGPDEVHMAQLGRRTIKKLSKK